LPPELKIVLYLHFVAGLFLIDNLIFFCGAAVIICILLFTVPSGFSRKGLIPIIILLVFTFIGNLLFCYGRVLYAAGPLIITAEGLTDASVKTLRMVCLIGGARILTASTSVGGLNRAFAWVLKPLQHVGIPVNEFVSIMGMTMQSLPALKNQFIAMYGERMRHERAGGFWNSARVVVALITPLFVRCLQSPEEVFCESRKVAK
jgi:energy-coupling factor transport system permease protein